MKRTYTIDFVRWKPPYTRNRHNRGKFTKTFNSMDELVAFMYKTTHSNFRMAESWSKYMSNKEFKIFRQKLLALEVKDKYG